MFAEILVIIFRKFKINSVLVLRPQIVNFVDGIFSSEIDRGINDRLRVFRGIEADCE